MSSAAASAPNRATVRVARKYAADQDRVFDAWLDPTKAAHFLFATPAGTMVKVEIDPRVGGRFRFVERRDGTDVEHRGEYLEIDRPHRLVFSFWVPQFSAEKTTIQLDFAPLDLGCVVTLTHEGVFEDFAARTEQGWTMILNGLAETLMP
ncbi:MAG TPA: SRPBCC domain-containing protein [Alphaproteobacteria bacterium]|jgi:uncharacterized protein YndB with AHSA1/START domain|nr:SRPBCC domain-containing protein [Alphaproteobacteria bacterium]